MPFTIHLLSCYWLIDEHRNLTIRNGDQPLQAYATVHAVANEPLSIECHPAVSDDTAVMYTVR